MRRPARIPRSVPVGKRKPSGLLLPHHHDYIVVLGRCIVCGAWGPVDPMHLRAGTHTGAMLKNDKYLLPGCRRCHSHQHTVGELTFWAELGIDPFGPAEALWRVTGDIDKGLRVIGRTLQAIALHKRTPANG